MDHCVSSTDSDSALDQPLTSIVVINWNLAVADFRSQDPRVKKNALRALRYAMDGIIEAIGPSWKFTAADPETVVLPSVLESLVPVSAETSFNSFLADPTTGGKLFRKTSPATSSVTPAVLEGFEEAFDKIKFVNKNAAVRLKKTLSDFAIQWGMSEALGWYAPFTALLNASMTGKSRLLVEMHNLDVFIFCMCFRADKRSSYRPMRTPFVADWATKGPLPATDAKRFTIEACALILACLKQLLSWLKDPKSQTLTSLAQRWYVEQQVDEKASIGFWRAIWEKMKKEVEEIALDKSSFDVITENFERRIQATKAEILLALCKIGIVLGSKDLHILFVFDEAGQLAKDHAQEGDYDLSNRLVLLRRALRCIPPQTQESAPLFVFCVLTDTTSEVATLSPISIFDDSYRLRLGGKRPFPPICLTFSIDIWWGEINNFPCGSADVMDQVLAAILPKKTTGSSLTTDKTSRKKRSSKRALSDSLSLSVLERACFMAVFGRPIFFSFLVQEKAKNIAELVSVDVLLNFLKKKLLRQPLAEAPTENDQSEKVIDEELVADFGVKQQYPKPGNPKYFTQAQVLAVLGSIASIEVNAGSRMASELVSGHLRLAAAVTKLRKYIYTFEVSEPMLALASHNLIIEKKLPWSVVIDKFNATQLNNSTATGYRGELAFQILSLMAWQNVLLELKASSGTGHISNNVLSFPSASVEKYLTSLFGSPLSELESNSKKLMTDVCEAKQIVSEGDLDYLRSVLRSFSGQGLSKREKWRRVTQKAAGRVNTSSLCATVQTACSQLNSAEIWTKVKSVFSKGRVRPYQFVKVIGKLTKALLVEFFVRGSVIVCRNNEGVVDVIIPVFFPSSDDDCVSVDKMGAIVIQIKLRAEFSSEADKASWLVKAGKLDFLANSAVPSLGVYCELGGQYDPEELIPDTTAASAAALVVDDGSVASVTSSKIEFVEHPTATANSSNTNGCSFAIFSRRLSVADIRANDRESQRAFHRLLESTVDPSESQNVDALFRKDIRKMFKVQPYADSNIKWANGKSVEPREAKRRQSTR